MLPSASLTVTDNRSGLTYEIPIENDAIRATDLKKIRTSENDLGLLSYDPAFLNTAACKSAITYIDGERGILRYRGYPIEELAKHCNFLEVAYLLLRGKLPTQEELAAWNYEISQHTFIDESIKKVIDGLHHDAHPMGILVGTVGAMSTFYPEAKRIFDDGARQKQIVRLIAKMPTVAAFSYRHAMGLPYAYPADLFLPGPVVEDALGLERALDTLFILHADHEQNCSTHAMRTVGSSHADAYSATAAAGAALYGPLHGGANEMVLRMLEEIGSPDRVPGYIQRVKQGGLKLTGFGHRIYKSYDPRAQIIKDIADQVFEVTGRSPLLDIALELERVALRDDYFISHKLYPNVDFYSGIIYLAMGFPVEMFPVLFAIGRTPGWLAQWEEGLLDPEQRITRPRQLYVGPVVREVLPLDQRQRQPGP